MCHSCFPFVAAVCGPCETARLRRDADQCCPAYECGRSLMGAPFSIQAFACAVLPWIDSGIRQKTQLPMNLIFILFFALSKKANCGW